MQVRLFLFFFSALLFVSCNEEGKSTAINKDETKVKLITTKGDIVLELYESTPAHRDNFIKLVKEKRYDSLLFHRVIENFMVQTGDPDSKNAVAEISLGEGDLPYTVPAEFTSTVFHKRGALGAARNGNIARASSAMQFYIVQGRVYTDSTLVKAEGRINKWLSEHTVVNDKINKEWTSAWASHAAEEHKMSEDSIQLLRARIDSLATIHLKTAALYQIPKAQREVYKSEGGAAHLDQNYTVFGEVLSGMNIIDSIAAAQTNKENRPLEDIRILSAEIIK